MPTSIRLKRLERLALQRASEVVLYELSDPRLVMVTITRVKLSSDLSHAVVFWSCLGDPADRSKVGRALSDAAGHVQSEIAKVFHTRRSPRITFEFDESIAGAIRVTQLIEGLAEEREQREGEAAEAEAVDDEGDGGAHAADGVDDRTDDAEDDAGSGKSSGPGTPGVS
jgi:ribosome-binding factor A